MAINNEKFIMTLDEGTTSARTLVINKQGKVVSVSELEFTQYFPHSGWVEHDPLEIWNTQLTTMANAKNKAKIKSQNIAALGITNQRETLVAWDKNNGIPVYNAIVWQDRRTADYCKQLEKDGHLKTFQDKTGLILDSYFTGTKIRWVLDNVKGAWEKAKKGDLLVGTVDSWLIWRLTDGKVHATDVSNASRTLLFNIHTQEWDPELAKILGVPLNILPEVKPSSGYFGDVNPKYFSMAAKGIVPIMGVAGDQQSALFGQLATDVGDVKNTYGTGCFALVNTGTKPVSSKNKLLTTIAWKLGNEKTVYALEGSIFVAGAAIQWLRDGLRVLYHASQSDSYASIAHSEQQVYVVPSFTGLGAPYWDPHSRGAIFGLERSTKREHIVKATLEAIAFQSNDLFMSMEKDFGKPINLLKVDGGASQSNYLMQFQSSISKLAVYRPVNIETTAMGAAFLAGLAVGFWKDIPEIKKIAKIDRIFNPKMKNEEIDKMLTGWNEAIKRTFNWTTAINKSK